MQTALTAVNYRTIAEHGKDACIRAYTLNVLIGEGPSTIGGGDVRLGNNLINAGRKIVAIDRIDINPKNQDL